MSCIVCVQINLFMIMSNYIEIIYMCMWMHCGAKKYLHLLHTGRGNTVNPLYLQFTPNAYFSAMVDRHLKDDYGFLDLFFFFAIIRYTKPPHPPPVP